VQGELLHRPATRGRCCAPAGSRAAEEQLRRALDLAGRCGAGALERRVRDELAVGSRRELAEALERAPGG
jgi:hypothetical protein